MSMPALADEILREIMQHAPAGVAVIEEQDRQAAMALFEGFVDQMNHLAKSIAARAPRRVGYSQRHIELQHINGSRRPWNFVTT